MNKVKFLTTYWQAVEQKNKSEFLTYFHEDAMIYLHDTNDEFPPEYYIREEDDFGNDWHTTVDRVEELKSGQIMTITFHRSSDWIGFVTSFFTFQDEKIIKLHEYFSPCDDNIVPQWRVDLKEEEKLK